MTLDDVRNSTAPVLTVAQVHRLLVDLDGQQLDIRTLRRACEDGQLPSLRVGKRILILRLPLLALLDPTGAIEPNETVPALKLIR